MKLRTITVLVVLLLAHLGLGGDAQAQRLTRIFNEVADDAAGKAARSEGRASTRMEVYHGSHLNTVNSTATTGGRWGGGANDDAIAAANARSREAASQARANQQATDQAREAQRAATERAKAQSQQLALNAQKRAEATARVREGLLESKRIAAANRAAAESRKQLTQVSEATKRQAQLALERGKGQVFGFRPKGHPPGVQPKVRFNQVAPDVTHGTPVFRAWGGGAGPYGRSWTTVDPRTVSNFRNSAGLPNVNSGTRVSEGILRDKAGVSTKLADPLDGNRGGLQELVIPDPQKQVKAIGVRGPDM